VGHTHQLGWTGASRAGVSILTLFQVGILGPALNVTAGLLGTVQETLVALVPGKKVPHLMKGIVSRDNYFLMHVLVLALIPFLNYWNRFFLALAT
jgi:hypothetical protein